MRLTVPDIFNLFEVEQEILASVGDRLRDDYGYERAPAPGTSPSAAVNSYPLNPAGSIVVEKERGRVSVKLHGVEANSDDLFTAVSSDLEQRHEGISAEID